MARLRARIERAAALHRQAAAATAAVGEAIEAYSPAVAPADQYLEQYELAARLRATTAELVPGWLGASLDALPATTPLSGSAIPSFVRVGLAHPLDDARFPAVAPLLGTGHLAIDADARDPRVAGLIRSLALRLLAAAAPGSVRIRVVDGAGSSDTVAAFRGVDDLMPPAVTDHRGLRGVLAEADVWVREPRAFNEYLVLVIASLPELTDGNDLARIAHLAHTGVGRQLHLIVAGWPPPPLTAETTQAPLAHSTQLSLRNPHAWLGDPPDATYAGQGPGPARLNSPVYLDPDPPVELIRRVCEQLATTGRLPEQPPWTAPPQRWVDYMAGARRLDLVRRSAAKVIAEQAALVKRARAELSTLRGQLTAQHSRITEVLASGQPLPLKPVPAEQAAADAALGRLAQAAATQRAAGMGQLGGDPHADGGSGRHTYDDGHTARHARRPEGSMPAGPPGSPPHPNRHPDGAGRAIAAESATTANRATAPGLSTAGPAPSFPGAGPASGPPATGAWPAQDPSTTGVWPARNPSTAGARPAQDPSTTRAWLAPGSPTTGSWPASGPPATGPAPSRPGAGPASGAGATIDAGRGAGSRAANPAAAPARPATVRPWGPPVSGQPHPSQLDSGTFPVVSAPPAGYPRTPITGAPTAPHPPLEASPRLPRAALTMLGEARAALAHADAELADINSRVNRSPGLRNAAIYAVFAIVFALAQVPVALLLESESNLPVLVGVPCGLVFVPLSFLCAWLTIGHVHRQPGGQRPHRSALLGVIISLGAAIPAIVLVLWSIGSALA